MNIMEVIAAAQGCAISIGFLYLVWQAPALLSAWASIQREAEQFRSIEREKDRTARHDAANVMMQAIAEINAGHKDDLRSVCESICRFRDRESG